MPKRQHCSRHRFLLSHGVIAQNVAEDDLVAVRLHIVSYVLSYVILYGMQGLSYSAVDLIELIHERPVLWAKSADYNVENKAARREIAWKEVAQSLFLEYDTLSAEDQKEIMSEITGKWKNLKDAFLRTVKRKNYQKRKYIFHDQLKFLLRPRLKSDSKDPLDVMEAPIEPKIELDENFEASETLLKPISPPLSPIRRKRKPVSLEVSRLVKALKRASPLESPPLEPSKEDEEDQAFFTSVLPSVKRMAEDEKLEFRMGVLQLIQKIRQNRKPAGKTEPTNS